MKRNSLSTICLLLAPLVLGGCSLLPVSFQVASFALDGISLVTTQKSLTDHGLSAVAQKDCALWRGVTGEGICQEEIDTSTTAEKAPTADQPIKIDSLYLTVI